MSAAPYVLAAVGVLLVALAGLAGLVKGLGRNRHMSDHRPDYALIRRLESELGIGVEPGEDPGCPFCNQDEVMAGEGLSFTQYLQGCTGCADRYFRDTGGYFALPTEKERR